MAAFHQHSHGEIEMAGAVLQSALHDLNARPHVAARVPRVFVTVSRQAGASGGTFARELVRRLNASGEGGWSCWDHELVEKVAAEYDIEATVIEMLEDRCPNWLVDLLEGCSGDAHRHPEELKVYRRVATTIGALASAGHAVIVGRGGVFITAGMKGGIHVRLVAPVAERIARRATQYNLQLKQAAADVAETDKNRDAFYRRYWPDKPLVPDSFTLTLNSAAMSLEEMVDCVVRLIKNREGHASHPDTHLAMASR
jgi:cytidylate kinase